MARKRPEQTRKRVSNSRTLGRQYQRAIAITDHDPRRHLEQRGLRFARVSFECRERRHRIIVKIERICLDEIEQRRDRQTEARHGIEQRCRDRIRGRLALPFAVEGVAPPLETDFARHRLARAVAYARDLTAECIEGEQRTAFVRRRKQSREKAIFVSPADQRLAIAMVLVHRRKVAKRRAQSTAIRAAPTRRRSPNRML